MEKFSLQRKTNRTRPQPGEIRISPRSRKNWIFRLILRNLENRDKVEVRARGSAIHHALIITERVKQVIKDLHQIVEIGVTELKSTWIPREEGLDIVETTKRIEYIVIQLSKTAPKDTNIVGYQAPPGKIYSSQDISFPRKDTIRSNFSNKPNDQQRSRFSNQRRNPRSQMPFGNRRRPFNPQRGFRQPMMRRTGQMPFQSRNSRFQRPRNPRNFRNQFSQRTQPSRSRFPQSNRRPFNPQRQFNRPRDNSGRSFNRNRLPQTFPMMVAYPPFYPQFSPRRNQYFSGRRPPQRD
ncbi:hypothetical protein M0811_08402 [Anaeramoeba ignava]|uniref:DNA/RNA-binding protein Alba-like domain-containing protein n=1 Tax=Anaeramoeba ignava TaxID=1746090 RepID=A0A9Q0LLY6_ANAIG|nr:hypothetical protein M0811_08402 [Anaeramoeba ignava]